MPSTAALAPTILPAPVHSATSTDNAAPTRFLDRPGGRIAYDDRGNGPLVLLVPGLGDVRGSFRFVAGPLAAAGFRVVTMDLRGAGESSTGWSDYSNAATGRDIIALIEALDAGPATIVGSSFGAGSAAWTAVEAPRHVTGLVLIGPFVREVPQPAWMRLVMKLAIDAVFVGPWGPKAWGAYYASLYKSRKPGDFDAYKSRLVASLAEPGRMAALQGMLRASKADVGARLAAVKAPTLVIMGGKDPDFADPAREANEVARLLHGTARMIEGVGHYPHVEVPETIASAIAAFAGYRSGA